jgi:hypothetical protein
MKIEKILVSIAFASIMAAFYFLVTTSPVVGYELSIYAAYPVYFWVLLVVGTSCGIAILVNQAFAVEKSRYWIAGFLAILVVSVLLLLLPSFRGYFFYGLGDTPSHLGRIRDILVSGYVGKTNIYPVEHILGAVLVEVAGLNIQNIPTLYCPFFSMVYLLNVFLLAKSIVKDFRQVLLIVAFASPLVYTSFSASIHPSFLSLYMVPCLLYLYQKREQFSNYSSRFTLPLILLTFVITLFHPTTAIFVLISLLVFGLARTFWSRLSGYKSFVVNRPRIANRNYIGLCLIIFIIFFLWYFSFSSIRRSFELIYNSIAHDTTTSSSIVASSLSLLSRGSLTTSQTLELFFNRYGSTSLILIFSGVLSLFVFRSFFKKNKLNSVKFTYAFQFLVFLLVGILMLFVFVVENEPTRVTRVAVLFGTILCGLILYDVIKDRLFKDYARKVRSYRRYIYLTFVVLFIVTITSLSIGSLYNSPRVFDFNHQVTRTQVAGFQNFETFKNSSVTVVANRPDFVGRFEDFLFGVDNSKLIRAEVDPVNLPSHFGYNQANTTEAQVFSNQSRYIVISELDKVYYQFFPVNVQSKINQYTPDDFNKLNSDLGVDKIYSNGGFEVWLVREK